MSGDESGGDAPTSIPPVPDGCSGASAAFAGRDANRDSQKKSTEPAPEVLHQPRQCYACKRRYRTLHHFYGSLCPECAALNWEKRTQTANLAGRVAVVTGARVKIGYRIALKLLRCGAAVVATTRFPRDAARRFAREADHGAWADRLHVLGADFRDLKALEAMCDALPSLVGRLDIIVNNACQTVRRPPQYYQQARRALPRGPNLSR